MGNRQLPGVQEHTLVWKRRSFPWGVKGIPYERVSDVPKVYPYLVRTARLQVALDQGEPFPVADKHTILRQGIPSVGDNRHPEAMDWIPSDRFFDLSFRTPERSPDERQVFFPYGPRFEGKDQLIQGLAGPSDDHETRRG